MYIRKATLGDARAIAHVQVEGWRSTYRGLVHDEILDNMSVDEREIQWREACQRSEVTIDVALADRDAVVAFASSGPERSGRDDFPSELYAIYILKEFRRQGIGKMLVRRAASAAMSRGHDRMLVWVFADNGSRRFYEALGGKLIDEQPLEVGKQTLVEVAYGWTDLAALAGSSLG